MRAMVLHRPGQPLQPQERPIPTLGSRQLLINVLACAAHLAIQIARGRGQ
ncbi:hypothetical protein BJ917_4467 [Pseudomonas sp. WPR_5_2]|nr:hypothetical protein BJ917_4467 [Pseudomonas sp. WPR_5_2]